MNNVTRSAFAILLLVASSSPVVSQASPPELLNDMAGTWDVTYEMAPGPGGGGGNGAGTMTSQLGPGGNSLILDYTSTSGPTRGFKIHQVIAWDADDEAYDIAWVDSFSRGVTTARGRPEKDGIAYSRESIRGEHKVVSKGVISVAGPQSFRITSYMSLDGGPDVKTMTLDYTRR